MKGKKGFTLVELMIVMVIIGILLSLLLPGIFSARQEALKTQSASNLRQIGIALYAHAKNNNGALPATLALLNTGTPKYLDDASVLTCPVTAQAYTYATGVASSNLYTKASTDVLVEAVTAGTGGQAATGYELRADGSVQ